LCTSLIPALGRLRQEDYEFQASLGYKTRLYLKQNKTKLKTKVPKSYLKKKENI
jgi:hypothetical protein